MNGWVGKSLPISHLGPENCGKHEQLNPPISSMQVPPFKHGVDLQSFISRKVNQF